MSNVRHRFFTAAPGTPLHERIIELVDQRRQAAAVIMEFAKEVGASNVLGHQPYVVDFDSMDVVDPQTWSKTRARRGEFFFRPRRNTPEGKAMAARMKQLPACPSVENALELANLSPGFPCVVNAGKGYAPFIRFHSRTKITIVSVPWIDVDPEKLAAYIEQANSVNRHSWCSEMEFAQWQAPEWMTEIKEWEALKIIADDEEANPA